MHYIHQDGQQVFKYAVLERVAEMSRARSGSRTGLTGADVDCFYFLEDKRIITATANRLTNATPRKVIGGETDFR